MAVVSHLKPNGKTVELHTPNKGGRPTKNTPETRTRLRRALLVGASKAAAAHYAGISEQVVYNWIGSDPSFAEFIEGCEKEMELRSLRRIAKSQDWRSRAWLLERRRSQEFGNKSQIEHTGGVTLAHELKGMSDVELSRLQHALSVEVDQPLLEATVEPVLPQVAQDQAEPVEVEVKRVRGADRQRSSIVGDSEAKQHDPQETES